MNGKHIVSLILALLLVFSLAACGSSSAEIQEISEAFVTPTPAEDEPETTEEPEETPAEVTDEDEIADEEELSDDAEVEIEDTDDAETEPTATATATTAAPTATAAPTVAAASSATSTPAPTDVPTATNTPEPTEVPATEAPAETESASKPTASDAAAYIGKSASSLASAIGQPNSKSYSSSCIGDGEDGEWYYDGFTVYTYRDTDGTETVEDVF
ncbi:MAG: hypothetical protein LUE22_05345 [Oscillospiraceae bacterium]|nr:hypothetical protein [Oscillospiraceae bacterium]